MYTMLLMGIGTQLIPSASQFHPLGRFKDYSDLQSNIDWCSFTDHDVCLNRSDLRSYPVAERWFQPEVDKTQPSSGTRWSMSSRQTHKPTTCKYT